jgi:predicted RNase H-like nuclease (RuvC/YqgF family)
MHGRPLVGALTEIAGQEVNLVEERYQRRLAEADASLAAAREEAHNLTKKVMEMEEEIKGEQGRLDELSRAVRAAEHERQKMADACDQVSNIVVFFF